MKTPAHWGHRGLLALALWPLSLVFGVLAGLRRAAYVYGVLQSEHPGIPVVVVGNITAGGSGKTPLVIALVKLLRQHGLRAGVVSRGHGGQGVEEAVPMLVHADSDPAIAGDEPVLIAQRAACPVAVCAQRIRAARLLQEHAQVDVLLTDDGLQHYALQRDIEIAVVDASAQLGNRFLLPAGPLREPPWRLDTVDHVVHNGDESGFLIMATGLYPINGSGPVLDPGALSDRFFHAVAGIARPEKFFALLRSLGLRFEPCAFADHHAFAVQDLDFGDGASIVMTEKDAVKCARLPIGDAWALRVEAVLARDWSDTLLRQVTELVAQYRNREHV